MTYIKFICDLMTQKTIGEPIYSHEIATVLAEHFNMSEKKAAAAAAVAIKRIMDAGMIPDLRFYQKGIYFRTVITPFGERGIDKEKLIADKYLLPDKGYETGPGLLYLMGLTTQIPRERLIATNVVKECVRTDKKLGVRIRPSKIEINAENKAYLQTLDVLELLDRAPIDVEQPYALIANHIRKKELQYDRLLLFANRYYNKKTVLQLARTVDEGGYAI